MKKNTHGGSRKGAGAKKKLIKKTSITITVDPLLLRDLELAYIKFNRSEVFSNALELWLKEYLFISNDIIKIILDKGIITDTKINDYKYPKIAKDVIKKLLFAKVIKVGKNGKENIYLKAGKDEPK